MPESPETQAPVADLNSIQPKLSPAPQWFTLRQQQAWHRFLTLPVPTAKDEHWRYSNAKRIDLDAHHPATAAAETLEAQALERSTALVSPSAKFVFVNDQLVTAQRHTLPDGVLCLPFAEALDQQPALLETHLMQREATLGSAKFAALHLAHLKAGIVISVPSGIEIDHPIEIHHWISAKGSTIFPHTLVVTGDHASVTVVDHYHSLDQAAGLAIAVADLVAAPGSRITYAQCQQLNDSSTAIHLSSTNALADATITSFQVQLGAAFSRSESSSHLLGPGSRSDMVSVAMPVHSQVVDQRTLQHHAAPHAHSDLLYKNALYDNSRTIFSGLITVDEGAHYTDAYQSCRNLLNSEEAEATSMPGLEINADQVKCSHGATSSPISDEELFYLKARGIDDTQSRKLIVQGFLENALERLGTVPLRAWIEQQIEAKLNTAV